MPHLATKHGKQNRIHLLKSAINRIAGSSSLNPTVGIWWFGLWYVKGDVSKDQTGYEEVSRVDLEQITSLTSPRLRQLVRGKVGDAWHSPLVGFHLRLDAWVAVGAVSPSVRCWREACDVTFNKSFPGLEIRLSTIEHSAPSYLFYPSKKHVWTLENYMLLMGLLG